MMDAGVLWVECMRCLKQWPARVETPPDFVCGKCMEDLYQEIENGKTMENEPTPYFDDENENVSEAWTPQTLEEADWCLKRLADLHSEVAENEAITESHIARLKLRMEALNARALRGVAYFEGRLKAFAETHREHLLKGGKKKSRALPHGTLGWRKKGGGLAVTDPEALLAWARSHPLELGYVRVKEEPVMAAIQNLFRSTGEIPPGCDTKPEVEEFHVTPLVIVGREQ